MYILYMFVLDNVRMCARLEGEVLSEGCYRIAGGDGEGLAPDGHEGEVQCRTEGVNVWSIEWV